MSVEDFFTEFANRELREVKLTSWKGKGDGIIFLRSLPYAEVSRFRAAALRIMQNRALDLIAGQDDDFTGHLDRAEDYLIKCAVCDSNGKLLFEDDTVFDKWRKNITPEIADEIIHHIEQMNQLAYASFTTEEVEKEHKKK
jgi:hypothetical protein